MNWRLKVLLLLVAAVPAFTGFPVNRFAAEIVPGARTAWTAYAVGVHALVGLVVGARAYGIMLSITAAVTLPVVMAGAAVSFLVLVVSGGGPTGVFAYSPHYVSLCLTLLAVVPLSLSLVAVLPFGRFEQGLLSRASGVTRTEKVLLMAIRVFNHVTFSVIPGILEVAREERLLFPDAASLGLRPSHGTVPALGRAVRVMVHVGVAAICTAVQFIPMWAVEIAQLPEKTPGNAGRTKERK